jgi:ATP-dependent helicase/DNAse subunit B
VRQLESLGACPFQHFARSLLGLRPRETAQSTPQLTRFYRKLFARALSLLRAANYDWDARRPEPIREAANQALAELAEGLLSFGDGTQHMLQRAGWLLERITTELAELPAGRAPLLLSTGYGSGQRLDPLVVNTPRGQVRVRGRIDRLDAADGAATVVDLRLRTGQEALNWQRFSGGAELALPAALLATRGQRVWDAEQRTTRELSPAAAEIGRIEPQWEGDAAQFGAAALRPVRARESANEKLDDLTDNTLRQTERLLAELAERLLAGAISIQPLRCGNWTACSACGLRPVCRFDPASGAEYREVLETNAALRDRIASGEAAPVEAAP